MKYIKRYTVIGAIFVLITGTLAHFLYNWFGKNNIIGLFTPVNGKRQIIMRSDIKLLQPFASWSNSL